MDSATRQKALFGLGSFLFSPVVQNGSMFSWLENHAFDWKFFFHRYQNISLKFWGSEYFKINIKDFYTK